MSTGEWIDVSVPIASEMPTWPGDPPVWVQETQPFEEEDPARVSVLSMGSHTGTHMDAPSHFLEHGDTIDEFRPQIGLGPAHVVHVPEAAIIEVEDLASVDLDEVDRLLIRTRNSPALWREDEFVQTFAHLSTQAAEHLAEAELELVGIDYLSVAGYERNEGPVHRALLDAGVWILEGLNLAGVPEGPSSWPACRSRWMVVMEHRRGRWFAREPRANRSVGILRGTAAHPR